MYDFMGLPYTALEANYVAIQSLGIYRRVKGFYSILKNSSVTAFRWRSKLSFSQVKSIQESCRSILQAYGYRIFDSSLS